MSPIPIAGPAVEPVTLAEAKAYLRLESEHEDALVESLVAAARRTLELATRRAFLAQSWRVTVEGRPGSRAVALPLAPVLEIVAVRVVSASGSPETLAVELYRLDDAADPPRLLVVADAPSPADGPGSIEIDARYGFGSEAADVPETIRLAILRLVARWFERRGDAGDGSGGLPADVQALIAPFIRARIA